MLRKVHRIAVALAVAAALLASAPLCALDRSGFGRAPAPPGLDALWAWVRAWIGIARDPAADAVPDGRKAGGSIDPNGQPAGSSSGGGDNEAGLSIDPDG